MTPNLCSSMNLDRLVGHTWATPRSAAVTGGLERRVAAQIS
jgi:hypothetical protein